MFQGPKIIPESVVWIYDTFDKSYEIENNFTKYSSELLVMLSIFQRSRYFLRDVISRCKWGKKHF